MEKNQHPQSDEVVEYLKANQDCAILHPDDKHEVEIEFDHISTWNVQAILKDPPAPDVQKQLKAAKLKTSAQESLLRFGPNRGQTVKFFIVAGDFKSPETAAHAALSAFAIAWAVPATQWLWVTALRFGERGKPKRPRKWPPVGK